MIATAPPPDDPSAARARTLLAWSRTAVTLFTLGAVAVRLLPDAYAARWLVSFVAVVAAIGAELHGSREYRRGATMKSRQRGVFLMAAAHSLIAAAVLAAVLV